MDDVFVQPVVSGQPLLNGDELARVALEGGEEEAGIKSPVGQQAIRVVVPAAQDPLPLASCPARIGQNDVGVPRFVSRGNRIEFLGAAERRAAHLAAAEHVFLLIEAARVPLLNMSPHTAHDQVGAALQPCRPLVADPDVGVHLRRVVTAQVVGAILEAEQIATGFGGGGGAGRLGEACLRPARPRGVHVPGDPRQVPHRMKRDLRVIGARLHGDIPTAAGWIEPVGRKGRQVDQRRWPHPGQSEARIKQRRAEPDRDRKPRSGQTERLARVGWSPVGRAGTWQRISLTHRSCRVRPGLKEPLQLAARSGRRIEGLKKYPRLRRRRDAGLMGPVKADSTACDGDGAGHAAERERARGQARPRQHGSPCHPHATTIPLSSRPASRLFRFAGLGPHPQARIVVQRRWSRPPRRRSAPSFHVPAVLSPEQLLDRLSGRLGLLRGGRGVDPRQQTLRATIEWSYDLLDADERRLFERLSVFHGGCTLEAAEEICEAEIDALQSLIHKSLIRRQGERFWMLETIREYAVERVQDRGEADVLADRHADYFIALTEGASRNAPDENVDQARRLYPELDNLRRALGWLAASGEVERELRLAIGAFWCLWTRASLRELHERLASALERGAAADAYLRTEALGAAALATANLGQAEASRTYARQSLALARERDDNRQIEWGLRVLSFDEPDLDERRRLLNQCDVLLRELGNRAGLGWVTYLRGITFVEEGDLDRGREMLNEAAALFRDLRLGWEATNADIAIGYALVAADRHAEARHVLEGALATSVEIASPISTMATLVLLAAGRMDADAATATRLMAAIRANAREEGTELDPRLEGGLLDAIEGTARERLGRQFEAEWAAGSQLTLEGAVALALDE